MKCSWKINNLIYACKIWIGIGKITHFYKFKGRNPFCYEKVGPSRYTLAQLSVLLLAGSVMYLGLYKLQFDLSNRQEQNFLWISLFFYSTKIFEKLFTGLAVKSDRFSYVHPWLDFWESLLLILFLEWGANILDPGIATPCSSCVTGGTFSWLLYVQAFAQQTISKSFPFSVQVQMIWGD